MATVDFSSIPVEPTITLIDGSDNDIVTTNNPIVLAYARVQIKHLNLKGWKIRTASGVTVNIKSNGKLEFWPEDEIPGDEYGKLLAELI